MYGETLQAAKGIDECLRGRTCPEWREGSVKKFGVTDQIMIRINYKDSKRGLFYYRYAVQDGLSHSEYLPKEK